MRISKSELMHLRIQALMRENDFGDEVQYLGYNQDKDEYMYLIAGEHEVGASQIEGFDKAED